MFLYCCSDAQAARQCYSNGLENLGNLGTKKEIQPHFLAQFFTFLAVLSSVTISASALVLVQHGHTLTTITAGVVRGGAWRSIILRDA